MKKEEAGKRVYNYNDGDYIKLGIEWYTISNLVKECEDMNIEICPLDKVLVDGDYCSNRL